MLIISTFFIKTAQEERKLIPYVIILIAIVLTYIYKIGEYPWGLHIDEAGAMYDGISIAKYGYDRYLKPFPVYFINFGGGQNALFTYVFAGWYKLLSLFVNIDLSTMSINESLFILRFPTLIYNLIAYLICFLIIKKEYGNKKALIGLIVFMATPFGLMHSRLSLESYYLFPTLLTAISLFIKGINNHSSLSYAFSGLFFGLTLYTYAISYLIIPLLMIILLAVIIYTKNFNIKNCVSFLIPLIIVSIPICLFFLINYLDIPEFKFLGMTITRLPKFRINEISVTNIKKNLLELELFKRTLYDAFDCNSFKTFSTIFYLNVPMVIVGLYLSTKQIILKIKSKIFCIDYIAMSLLLLIIIGESFVGDLTVNKLNAIYIPILFFATKSYLYIMNRNKVVFRLIIFVLLMNYILFINMYYSYNQRILLSQDSEILEQIQMSKKLRKLDSRLYYKTEYGINNIYFAIYNNIEPNEYLNIDKSYIEYSSQTHKDDDIYLIDDCFDDTNDFDNERYKLVKNGRYNLYYK